MDAPDHWGRPVPSALISPTRSVTGHAISPENRRVCEEARRWLLGQTQEDLEYIDGLGERDDEEEEEDDDDLTPRGSPTPSNADTIGPDDEEDAESDSSAEEWIEIATYVREFFRYCGIEERINWDDDLPADEPLMQPQDVAEDPIADFDGLSMGNPATLGQEVATDTEEDEYGLVTPFPPPTDAPIAEETTPGPRPSTSSSDDEPMEQMEIQPMHPHDGQRQDSISEAGNDTAVIDPQLRRRPGSHKQPELWKRLLGQALFDKLWEWRHNWDFWATIAGSATDPIRAVDAVWALMDRLRHKADADCRGKPLRKERQRRHSDSSVPDRRDESQFGIMVPSGNDMTVIPQEHAGGRVLKRRNSDQQLDAGRHRDAMNMRRGADGRGRGPLPSLAGFPLEQDLSAFGISYRSSATRRNRQQSLDDDPMTGQGQRRFSYMPSEHPSSAASTQLAPREYRVERELTSPMGKYHGDAASATGDRGQSSQHSAASEPLLPLQMRGLGPLGPPITLRSPERSLSPTSREPAHAQRSLAAPLQDPTGPDTRRDAFHEPSRLGVRPELQARPQTGVNAGPATTAQVTQSGPSSTSHMRDQPMPRGSTQHGVAINPSTSLRPPQPSEAPRGSHPWQPNLGQAAPISDQQRYADAVPAHHARTSEALQNVGSSYAAPAGRPQQGGLATLARAHRLLSADALNPSIPAIPAPRRHPYWSFGQAQSVLQGPLVNPGASQPPVRHQPGPSNQNGTSAQAGSLFTNLQHAPSARSLLQEGLGPSHTVVPPLPASQLRSATPSADQGSSTMGPVHGTGPAVADTFPPPRTSSRENVLTESANPIAQMPPASQSQPDDQRQNRTTSRPAQR